MFNKNKDVEVQNSVEQFASTSVEAKDAKKAKKRGFL